MTWANWLLILLLKVYQSLESGISESTAAYVFFNSLNLFVNRRLWVAVGMRHVMALILKFYSSLLQYEYSNNNQQVQDKL